MSRCCTYLWFCRLAADGSVLLGVFDSNNFGLCAFMCFLCFPLYYLWWSWMYCLYVWNGLRHTNGIAGAKVTFLRFPLFICLHMSSYVSTCFYQLKFRKVQFTLVNKWFHNFDPYQAFGSAHLRHAGWSSWFADQACWLFSFRLSGQSEKHGSVHKLMQRIIF